jgi:hypothetical protein
MGGLEGACSGGLPDDEGWVAALSVGGSGFLRRGDARSGGLDQLAKGCRGYGITRNGTLLFSVPFAVVT